MIVIIDYGMGNLRSVQKAVEHAGAKAKISQKAEDIQNASKVILPGVGAIQPAVEKLSSLNLIGPIKNFIKEGKPFLGICLGLQLLFDKSNEGGDVKGLGILAGDVVRFTSLKVPHMGWNQLKIKNKKCPLFKGVQDGADVYFCHSYYVQPKDKNITATATGYGRDFVSSINIGNIYGVQFHPEKSQTAGLKILENFIKL